MLARDLVTEALRTTLPRGIWIFNANGENPDAIERGTVVVETQSVEPDPSNPREYYRYTFELHLLTPFEDVSRAQTHLDALLADTLHALDKVENLTWSRADRSVWGENRQAFTVTVTTIVRNQEP